MDDRRRYGREIRDLQQKMASGQGDTARQQARMDFLKRGQTAQQAQNAVAQPPLRQVQPMPGLQQPGQPPISDLRQIQPAPGGGMGGVPGQGLMLDATRAGNNWQGIPPPNGMPSNNGLRMQPDGQFSAPNADNSWMGRGNPNAPGSNGLRGNPDGTFSSPAADGWMGPMQQAVGAPGRMPMTPRPMPGMQSTMPQPQGYNPQQMMQAVRPPLRRPGTPQGLLTRPPRMGGAIAPDDRVNGPVSRY